MTTDLTDQNEREAIQEAEDLIKFSDNTGLLYVQVHIRLIRALLHRATRAHD